MFQLLLLGLLSTASAVTCGKYAKPSKQWAKIAGSWVASEKCECMHPSMKSHVDDDGRFACACASGFVAVPIRRGGFACKADTSCSKVGYFKLNNGDCEPCSSMRGTLPSKLQTNPVDECLCRDESAKWSVSDRKCVCPEGLRFDAEDKCSSNPTHTPDQHSKVMTHMRQMISKKIEELEGNLKDPKLDEATREEDEKSLVNLKKSLADLNKTE